MANSKLLGNTGIIKMKRLNSFDILMTTKEKELCMGVWGGGIWAEKNVLEHTEKGLSQSRCLEIVT